MASMCTHPYMAAHLSCPTGSSSLRWVLTSFVLPVHNRGRQLSLFTGSCPLVKIPAGYQLILCTFITDQTLQLQHLSVDASCNHYGCSLLLCYAAFSCSFGCRISSSIFDASYLTPLVRITWNTLINLQATAISDCIFFNGFFSLVV